MALEADDGLARRPLAPELLDEQLRGHDATQACQQQGEQGALPWRAERELAPVVVHRHGAQNAQQWYGPVGGL
ncbi:hypothetical protein GCM10010319_67870 [Streptomyces blastmyceticus]|uniref:Uncharacterized protein n=1 Tax=Streptomyces blastmyceticus TaxID=68180 RepID=A0ABN0Y1N2_9ACTN